MACAEKVDPSSFYFNFEGMKLVDQNNNSFSVDQLKNQITLFNFIYTQCANICSTQTKDLLSVYKKLSPALKKNIKFVSISLDPVKDNPKQLKTFAQRLKADLHGWFFISSNFMGIRQLATKLTLFKPDYGETIYEALEHTLAGTNNNQYKLEEHTGSLWLIDKTGRVRQRYVGHPVNVIRLEKELKVLHDIEFSQK